MGKAVFGEEKEKLKAWLKPLIKQLKREPAVKVIRQLEALQEKLSPSPARETVGKEINYLREHQDRMDYRAALRNLTSLFVASG